MYFYVLISKVAQTEQKCSHIQTEHKDIEIHIKYRNKKLVTNSKGAPTFLLMNSSNCTVNSQGLGLQRLH